MLSRRAMILHLSASILIASSAFPVLAAAIYLAAIPALFANMAGNITR